MGKTRERVVALSTLLDEAIASKNPERIETIYGVFHSEREYLNVELDEQIDDAEPEGDAETCPHSIGRSSTGDALPCGEPVADGDNLCHDHVKGRDALLGRKPTFDEEVD